MTDKNAEAGSTVQVQYFSDVLCIWAYAAHRRLEELKDTFKTAIQIDVHYCSVFPDARSKISKNWGAENDDGTGRFNAHIKDVAQRFPHVTVKDDLWLNARPRTSMTAHIFLKAIQLMEQDKLKTQGSDSRFETSQLFCADWAVRRAFFEDGLDISDWAVLQTIAQQLEINEGHLTDVIHSSQAIAALASDYALCHAQAITVSPTYVMNEGRQKLAGNVGYRILEANVEELLHSPDKTQASWC